jgi:ribosomal protein S20
MPQGDQGWQGHASRKLPTGNDVQGDRGKKILAEATGLEDGIGKVGYGHGVHGQAAVHVRNSEVSYQNSEVRFAAKKEEEDDDSKEEDAIVEQFMETVVIEGNGEAKGVVVQNSASRSKVN